MTTISINIDTSNAAFFDDVPGAEFARILRALADSVDGVDPAAYAAGSLYDINGNRVGQVTVEEDA